MENELAFTEWMADKCGEDELNVLVLSGTPREQRSMHHRLVKEYGGIGVVCRYPHTSPIMRVNVMQEWQQGGLKPGRMNVVLTDEPYHNLAHRLTTLPFRRWMFLNLS